MNCTPLDLHYSVVKIRFLNFKKITIKQELKKQRKFYVERDCLYLELSPFC